MFDACMRSLLAATRKRMHACMVLYIHTPNVMDQQRLIGIATFKGPLTGLQYFLKQFDKVILFQRPI
jgi:hypothetical protein